MTVGCHETRLTDDACAPEVNNFQTSACSARGIRSLGCGVPGFGAEITDPSPHCCIVRGERTRLCQSRAQQGFLPGRVHVWYGLVAADCWLSRLPRCFRQHLLHSQPQPTLWSRGQDALAPYPQMRQRVGTADRHLQLTLACGAAGGVNGGDGARETGQRDNRRQPFLSPLDSTAS